MAKTKKVIKTQKKNIDWDKNEEEKFELTITITTTTTTTTTIAMAITIFRRSFVVSAVVLLSSLLITAVSAHNAVLNVKYKYAGQEPSITQLKAHDTRRQLGILAGVDLPLGGSGRPDAVG